jgi:hypothetical protein
MVSVFRGLCLYVFDNLESGTAEMIRLGVDVDNDVAGFLLRFQVLLVLEPQGLVEKTL